MTISEKTLAVCKDNFISLEELVYLYSLMTSNGWEIDLSVAQHDKLKRLGYIDGDYPTPYAESVVADAIALSTHKENYSSEFESFWRAFPRGTEEGRTLRTQKARAYALYSQALASGHAPQHLLSKLKEDVDRKTSSKDGLKYMRGIVNWLRLETYNEIDDEPIILSRAKIR